MCAFYSQLTEVPSVLVEAVGPDPKGVKAGRQVFDASKDGTARFSASGILWKSDRCKAVVLAPASLVTSFLNYTDVEPSFSLLPYTRLSCTRAGAEFSLRLKGVVEVPGVCSAVEALLSGGRDWIWGWRLKNGSLQPALPLQASIAVLELMEVADMPQGLNATRRVAKAPLQGTKLWCKGSPFGCLAPGHFQDYLTTGIVATAPTESSPIFIADMHCLAGMEGAPVVTSDGCLQGMLAQPLTSTIFDAEVALVITATSLYNALRAWQSEHAMPGSEARNSFAAGDTMRPETQPEPQAATTACAQSCEMQAVKAEAALETEARSGLAGISDSVVAVVSGNSWASGIVISSCGIVLTAAHALDTDERNTDSVSREVLSGLSPNDLRSSRKTAQRYGVMVGVRDPGSGMHWVPAEIVFRFTKAMDLAVLRIAAPAGFRLCPARLSAGNIEPGQPVLLIGYGLFSPRHHLNPLMSGGIISKIVRPSSGEPGDLVVLTNAALYSGASGGALFSSGGELLGIATSNTRHAKTGRSFARLNFSIAADSLRPLWRLLERGKLTVASLDALDVTTADLRAAWLLQASPGAVEMQSPEEMPLQRLSRLLERSGVELKSTPNSRL